MINIRLPPLQHATRRYPNGHAYLMRHLLPRSKYFHVKADGSPAWRRELARKEQVYE